MTRSAMARWQPIASVVTTQPSSESISSSFGMAVISLDPSSTATWPKTSRAPQAQAETRCKDEASVARSYERRSVSPSTATMPCAASAKRCMKREKHASNRAGSSRRNTRPNVSWLGTPRRSGRKRRRNPSLARPNTAMSEQSSARTAWRRTRSPGSRAGRAARCPRAGPPAPRSRPRTLPWHPQPRTIRFDARSRQPATPPAQENSIRDSPAVESDVSSGDDEFGSPSARLTSPWPIFGQDCSMDGSSLECIEWRLINLLDK